MKKTKKTKGKEKNRPDLFTEIVGICMIGMSVLMLASLYTSQVGLIGDGIKLLLVGLLGISGYIMPFYLVYMGFLYVKGDLRSIRQSCFYVLPIMLLTTTFFQLIASGRFPAEELLSAKHLVEGAWFNGGWFGALISTGLLTLFGVVGTYILISILFIIWLLLVTKFPLFSWLQYKCELLLKKAREKYIQKRNDRKLEKASKKAENLSNRTQPTKKKDEEMKKEKQQDNEEVDRHPPIIINNHLDEAVNEAFHAGEQIEIPFLKEMLPEQAIPHEEKPQKIKASESDLKETWDEINKGEYVEEKPYYFPPVNLLAKKETPSTRASSRDALSQARKLEDTLLSFGVEAKVTQINQGPTVTRYELQPKQGVKVSKIVNLSDDIALNLAASGIRIEAPIPGKAAVGIEVPNESSEMVYLREVIDTDQFKEFPSPLAFSLGRDIGGKPIITDIGKMPHMLIAGATGSGKSVCINTLITSILYKAKPSEVKLIMIDPKVVELNVYNGIPHLMIPVVTDPKKAAGALSWAVNEMTKRYQLFAENNVRDMKGYNAKMSEDMRMPNIIIIIDELADLMMTAAKEVEDAICRLAQMARAAGIHLVIATQRPSVDVITGVIKANIPSRLAFAVSSGIDSRTILDMNGAEKLLGKGDMLFYPVGEAKPIRIQGAFISDKEVESIVNFVKQTGEPVYEESIIETMTTSSIAIESGDEDELLGQAMELIKGKDKVSISALQRYFRIGFNRASRLMELLEARGMVGPDEGSKPRKVLHTIQYKEEEYV